MMDNGDESEVEPGWYVQVNGSQDHQRVIDKLTLQGVQLVLRKGNWLLWLDESQEVRQGKGPADRLEAARSFIAALNGLAGLGVPLPSPLSSSAVFHIDEDGKGQIYVFASATVKASVTASVKVERDGETVEELDHIDLATPEMPTALATPARRRAMRLLRENPGFRELNVIIEDAFDELGGRKGLEEGDFSWDEIKRFKQTANSLEAAGDMARHGGSKSGSPPKSPMTLSDALDLVHGIVQYWLRQDSP